MIYNLPSCGHFKIHDYGDLTKAQSSSSQLKHIDNSLSVHSKCSFFINFFNLVEKSPIQKSEKNQHNPIQKGEFLPPEKILTIVSGMIEQVTDNNKMNFE